MGVKLEKLWVELSKSGFWKSIISIKSFFSGFGTRLIMGIASDFGKMNGVATVL